MTEEIERPSQGTDDKSFSDAAKLEANISPETIENLEKRVNKLHDDLNDSKEEFKKSRYDVLTVLAVFVGLITYLGLEIQVFKEINNPYVIVGVSIFFISSILLFILTINTILRESEITWKKCCNPLIVILVILLLISIRFIIIGHGDYLHPQKNKNESLISFELSTD